MAVFFSNISPLRTVVFDPRLLNPIITAATVGLCGSLLLLAVGPLDLKASTLISLLFIVFELGVIVDVLEEALNMADKGVKISFFEPMAQAMRATRDAPIDSHDLMILLATSLGMIAAEELSKLGVVLVFIRMRLIRSPQAAIGCAALAGLTFGLIESNAYGYLNFAAGQSALPEYFTRYLIMSPVHALWDMIGVGIAFALAARRGVGASDPQPSSLDCVLAFIVTNIIHNAHNDLQPAVGAQTQYVSVLLVLLIVYVLAKKAWRGAAWPPAHSNARGGLVFLGLLLGGGSVAMGFVPRQTALAAEKVDQYAENIRLLQNALEHPEAMDLQSASFRNFEFQIGQFRPSEAGVGDAIHELLEDVRHQSAMPHEVTFAPFWLENMNTLSSVNQTIRDRRAAFLLNQCRFAANDISWQHDLDPQFGPTSFWRVEAANVELPQLLLHTIHTANICLVIVTSDNDQSNYFAAACGPKMAPNTSSTAKSWKSELYLESVKPTLCVVAINGDNARVVDRIELPEKDFSGELSGKNGSGVRLIVQHEIR